MNANDREAPTRTLQNLEGEDSTKEASDKDTGRIRAEMGGRKRRLLHPGYSGILKVPALNEMVAPCEKCGAEKTESVDHGLLYALAKVFGYRLRMCSRCRRLRLLPRRGERIARGEERKPRPESKVPGACPQCGEKDYRRSRRRWWERAIRRGPMVRCRACRTRFPMPEREVEEDIAD